MFIRQATLTDVTSIAHIHIDSWRAAYQGIVSDDDLQSLSDHQRMQMWTKIISESIGTLQVIVDNGKLLGFCHFGPARDEDVNGGEIIALYMAPDFYRQGLGTLLMQRALEHLAEDGHTLVITWTLQDNNNGIAFYEHHGFSFDGKLDRSKQSNLVEMRLSKGLPQL